MKKGDKVKCVDSRDSEYLTDGKEYVVTTGAGDVNMFGRRLDNDSDAFEVIDDEGDIIFCRGPDSQHATWELVE